MKNNKNFRKDDLSPESNTKKIYKMYKSKKQWVVAPIVFGLLLNSLSPIAALAVTETESDVKTVQVEELSESQLDALRIEAEKNILVLVSLTKEAKDQHIKELKDALTVFSINEILKNARKADIVQSVMNEKDGYVGKINALNFLTASMKENYIGSINALGLNKLEADYDTELNSTNDYVITKEAFDAKLAEIKVEAEKIVEQATTEDNALANIPQYKAEQKAVVNGLTQITELQKQDYAKQIDAIETKAAVEETKAAIDAIVKIATDENTKLLSEKITKKIADLKTKVAEIKEVDVDKYGELEALIVAVGEESTDATLNKLVELEAVITKGVQDVLDNNLATALKNAKTELKTTILNDKKANDLITDAEVNKFTANAENAKTLDALKLVESDWKELVAAKDIEKKDTDAARTDAKDLVSKLDLDDVQKNNYITSIELAKDSKTIAKIVTEAQTAARELKEKLQTAKDQTIKAINALTNLPDEAKTSLIEAVKTATTQTAVAEWLAIAKKDDAAFKLDKEKEAAKEAAKEKINGFKNLSDDDKELYQEQIDKVEDAAEITGIMNEAIYADYQAGVAEIDNENIAEAKALAKAAVNKLENLTAAERTAAFKDIEKATEVKQITAALNLAKTLDEKNASANEAAKELEKYKEDKKAEIDALKSLSNEVKNGYKGEINLAKNSAEVDEVFDKAEAANNKIEADKEHLDNVKKELIATIKESDELTEAEKKRFISQTYDCKSLDEIETLEAKIEQLILDHQVANTATDDYKSAIKDAIKQLSGLKEKQIKAYQAEVEAAKDKTAAVKIYEAAKKEGIRVFDLEITSNVDSLIASGSYVEAQKEINKLKSDAARNQYQKKLNDSITLTGAKAEANKQIDALENLSIEEKAAAKEKISKLTTKTAVEKEINALVKADNLIHDKAFIELAEAQIKAKEFEKATKTIEQIRDADTKAKLQKQLEDAQKVAPNIKGTGHVSEIGWQGYKANGALAGTTGKSLQMEAIQIKLTGELAKRYDVQYRAHSKDKGWSKYVSNGATAGTTGKSLRMEAVQVRLVEKK